MEISFSHQLSFEDYKKWLIDVYYLKNKKRLYGYIGMILAGVLVIIFKLFNAFGLSDRYPDETLFLLGGSLIVSPIFFYIGVIRNSKEYFNSDAAIHKEVKYIFDDDKLTFESYDGNTGTCKWKNIKTIVEDDRFIRIVLPNDAAFLFVKNKIAVEKLHALQQLLNKVKNSKTAFEHLN
jgi:hypothetical protein